MDNQLLEVLMKEMFGRLAKRIVAEMPETGEFEPICEGFDNPDSSLVAKRFWLEAFPAPEGVEDWEVGRGLALHAGKEGRGGHECSVNVFVRTGTKQEILTALQTNDPVLLQKCLRQAENLSDHLIDLH